MGQHQSPSQKPPDILPAFIYYFSFTSVPCWEEYLMWCARKASIRSGLVQKIDRIPYILLPSSFSFLSKTRREKDCLKVFCYNILAVKIKCAFLLKYHNEESKSEVEVTVLVLFGSFFLPWLIC